MTGASPVVLIEIGHPHGLRYLLTYPVFVVSHSLGIRFDYIFSIVCMVLVALVAHVTHRIRIITLHPADNSFDKFIISSLYICISLVMNGRILFAFLGYSLSILLFVSASNTRRFNFFKSFLILGISSLLMSVSSGTLSEFYLYCIAIFFLIILQSARSGKLYFGEVGVIISIIIVLFIFIDPFIIGIEKNIAFYGGGPQGLIHMLSHGFGKLFSMISPLFLVIVFPILLLVGLLICKFFKKVPFDIFTIATALIVACAAGAFGYSVLSLAIVPTLALFTPTAFGSLGHEEYRHGK